MGTGIVVSGRWVWSLLADEQGRFDVSQFLHAVALVLLSYGGGLIHPAGAYLAPGIVLAWWTLPSRPPFVMRGKSRGEA